MDEVKPIKEWKRKKTDKETSLDELKKTIKVFHKNVARAYKNMIEAKKKDRVLFKGSQWKESDVIKIRKPNAKKLTAVEVLNVFMDLVIINLKKSKIIDKITCYDLQLMPYYWSHRLTNENIKIRLVREYSLQYCKWFTRFDMLFKIKNIKDLYQTTSTIDSIDDCDLKMNTNDFTERYLKAQSISMVKNMKKLIRRVEKNHARKKSKAVAPNSEAGSKEDRVQR